MKFAALALVGAASAITLQRATLVVDRWDANHDGCLEFPEFWAFMEHRAAAQGQALPPQFRGLLHMAFNQHAGPDHCLQPAELTH